MNTIGFLLSALLASPAAAPLPEPPAPAISDADRAQAQRLHEEGLGFFKAQVYPDAMDRFAAAHAIDPSPVLLYNMARAAEESGAADVAMAHYRAYLERFPEAEDRPVVERRIRILEAALRNASRGSIAVVQVPAGARVLINEKPAGDPDNEGNWRRDPGTYALKVESEEGAFSTEIEVKAGEVTTVTLAAPVEEPGDELAIAGWSTLGAGALIGATGLLFWAEAHDAADTRQSSIERIAGGDTTQAARSRKRQAEREVESNRDTALLLWTLGGAALATGAGLLIYDTLTEEPQPTASLIVLPQGVGVSGCF